MADATAEAHEAEVAEVVDPASEVSDQSWIMEEPVNGLLWKKM